MSDYPRTCRFCRKQGHRLIKYEVRHYAHTKCLIAARGEEFVLALPVGQIGALEVFALSEAGRERAMEMIRTDRDRAARASAKLAAFAERRRARGGR